MSHKIIAFNPAIFSGKNFMFDNKSIIGYAFVTFAPPPPSAMPTNGGTMQNQIKRVVPAEVIQNKIYMIRGQKVMLDRDLATLYGVLTRNLNKAVRRNLDRFPSDFGFILTKKEFKNLMFQFGTSSWGGTRKLPMVFTEQGVAMLSSVLSSKRAIHVNIQIIRVFTKLRAIMASHKDLARKIQDLERTFQDKFQEHDQKIILVFNAIKELLVDKEAALKKKGPMGFAVYKQSEIVQD